MIAELVYLPMLLLIGLGILLFAGSLPPADVAPMIGRPFGAGGNAPPTLDQMPPRPTPVTAMSDSPSAAPEADAGIRNDRFAQPILTSTEDPAVITDFSVDESLIIELPDALADETATADLSESGFDTKIKVANQTIAVLQGFTNIDALDVQFIVSPAPNDAGAVNAASTPQTLADPRPDKDIMAGRDRVGTFIIEAGDAVVTVADFDVTEDQLQIGENGALTFDASNDGADTTVLVDGIAVFLLKGVTPAQLKAATITNIA